MGEIKDGGPAFPHQFEKIDSPRWSEASGLTIRDWFAGQALASGLCSGTMPESELRRRFPAATSVDTAEIIACQAYGLADALLRAREGGSNAE